MRANPDAIVRLASPTRRPRARSRSAGPQDGSSGAEDEYHADNDENAEESQSQVHLRRKGKAREEPDRPALDPSELPEALNDTFSSSDDDLPIITPVAGKGPPKEKRRRKPKPFPLKMKDLQPSNSQQKSPVSHIFSYVES